MQSAALCDGRRGHHSLDAHHRYANFVDLSDPLALNLRAVTGNLDVVASETLGGFNPDMIPESELALHDHLSDEQKAKQLGYEKHPATENRDPKDAQGAQIKSLGLLRRYRDGLPHGEPQ